MKKGILKSTVLGLGFATIVIFTGCADDDDPNTPFLTLSNVDISYTILNECPFDDGTPGTAFTHEIDWTSSKALTVTSLTGVINFDGDNAGTFESDFSNNVEVETTTTGGFNSDASGTISFNWCYRFGNSTNWTFVFTVNTADFSEDITYTLVAPAGAN